MIATIEEPSYRRNNDLAGTGSTMFTPQFERYIQPALPRAQIWRLLLGSLLIVVFYGASIASIFGAIYLLGGSEALEFWITKLSNGTTPTGTMLLLATFVGLVLAPVIVVRWVHKRPARTLFGPRQVLWRDFSRSAILVFVVYGALIGLWSIQFDAVANLDLTVWLTFLPLAIIGVFLQTLAEELVFRGYLQQQLAARFNSAFFWMIIPALLFGAVHYDPSSGTTDSLILMGSALLFGLIAADLTRVTGSLGACWGFHFANNVIALLILATKGTIPGLALYVTPYSIDEIGNYPMLIAQDIGTMIVVWIILRRVLTR